MNIPELIVAEEVLPEARRKASLELHSRGWSQSRISSVLGTSQSMVSRYLSENNEPVVSIQRMVDIVSRELVAGALSGEDLEALSVRFCSIVQTCMRMGLMTERFTERFGYPPHAFVYGNDSAHGSRFDVLNDMESALNILKGRDLSGMVPALKINLAQVPEGGDSVEDVVSFPGRLTDRNGVITGARAPEYGASRHLAGTLLKAMEKDPSVKAVGSIRFSGELENIVSRKGLSMIERESLREEPELPMEAGTRFVADPGDFGVEPCLYVFGISAMDVAVTIVELKEDLDRWRMSHEKKE